VQAKTKQKSSRSSLKKLAHLSSLSKLALLCKHNIRKAAFHSGMLPFCACIDRHDYRVGKS
jgi:hypothetical protein